MYGWRLTAVTIPSTMALILWLVNDHELCERPESEEERARSGFIDSSHDVQDSRPAGRRRARTGPATVLTMFDRSRPKATANAMAVNRPGSTVRPSSIAWIFPALTPDRAASSFREIFSTSTL